jgi:diaminopimelate decarboxylase
MHHFQYRGDSLYAEGLPVSDIADAVGTPFYLYSHATLKRHYQAFDNAFKGAARLVCFSAKSNSSLAVLKLFQGLGSGLDIVSGGELYRGLNAGFAPDRIVYSGVGKRIEEIDEALVAGIRMFNVESVEELRCIDQRAGILGKTAPVAIRVNPDVDPQTHPYISTGLEKNKFGIDAAAAIDAYALARDLAHVEPVGIDCHIGSQITQVAPFRDALTSLTDLVEKLRKMGLGIQYLDMGGGLGIAYGQEAPPHPDEYARAIVSAVGTTGLELILEPGRVIVGNAGILVTRVLYRKQGRSKLFVVVDAGMNDLMRPTLYDAYHAIEPVVRGQGAEATADVVGPICESGDFLALDRRLARPGPGDLLAVMSAGAYGFTMSSNYCSRPRVAEVMVSGDRYHVIRRRQGYADLVAGEQLPSFLEMDTNTH